MYDDDDRPRARGLLLRSLLVLVLDARRGSAPMTVPELVEAAEQAGFAFSGRPGKAVSDALRWELERGRARRVGRGRYAAGYVAKSTRHRMQARVSAWRLGGATRAA